MIIIPKISGRDRYFGNSSYLPSIIPIDFPNKTFFHTFIHKLFFEELLEEHYSLIKPKDNVDKERAFMVIDTILRSFAKEHEEKIHGCAYLMYLWFDKLKDFPKKKKK